MIGFVIICCLGVVSGVSLYREGVFTPAPPGGRPPCATKGKTFCENVDKYPTKIIQKLLNSKFTSFDDFFTDESEGLDEPPEYLLQEDMIPEYVAKGSSKGTMVSDAVAKESRKGRSVHEAVAKGILVAEAVAKGKRKGRSVRGGGSPSEQELEKCPVQRKEVRPQLAANSEGEWRFIVQDQDNNQTVEVQLCDQKEDCRDYCTQFHSRVSLVSVDPSGKFHKDFFWLPSSCICHTQLMDDILS
ncbi:hypothetical protein JTE90_004401 [Oedothorax gibbosus]|uniref:Spaetzle domain-containing protein n=1 Tax=Oedothorax gibbosus TaxID=931172 RepID=A0AAV6UQ61_9ARAC|nr:hypothetical protein JTE90_004401 [Oedothorax gibbosus]